MRLSRFVPLLALVALLVAATQVARGQTPPTPPGQATATPTATVPTYPDAQGLIDAANAAIDAKNTVHESVSTTIDVPDVGTIVDKGPVDTKNKPYRLHSKDTETDTDLTTNTTKKAKTEVIDVGNREAVRKLPTKAGKKAGKWKCSSISGGSGGVNTSTGSGETSSLTTIGPATVNGVLTWDVQESVTENDGSGSLTVDIFIGQADNLPITEVLSGTVNLSTGVSATISGKATFSKFGEKFNETLPKTCAKKKKIERVTVTSMLRHSLGLSLSRARLALQAARAAR